MEGNREKGHKKLNAATLSGIELGGLTMKACSFICLSLIVTFASKLWFLKNVDIDLLDR